MTCWRRRCSSKAACWATEVAGMAKTVARRRALRITVATPEWLHGASTPHDELVPVARKGLASPVAVEPGDDGAGLGRRLRRAGGDAVADARHLDQSRRHAARLQRRIVLLGLADRS